MKDQLYNFGNLDIHSAIIIQRALEVRKADMTAPTDPNARERDKKFLGRLDEIEQLHHDLSLHIAEQVTIQEYASQSDPLFKSTVGK